MQTAEECFNPKLFLQTSRMLKLLRVCYTHKEATVFANVISLETTLW